MKSNRGSTNWRNESSSGSTGRSSGNISVREAGHLGGEKVKAERGSEFFSEIGHKGGQRVRELINAGKKAEGE